MFDVTIYMLFLVYWKKMPSQHHKKLRIILMETYAVVQVCIIVLKCFLAVQCEPIYR